MGSSCLTKVAQNVRQISGHRAQRPKNTAIPSQTRRAATNQRPDSDHENGAMCSHKNSRSRSKKTSTPGRPPHQTKLTNRNSGNRHKTTHNCSGKRSSESPAAEHISSNNTPEHLLRGTWELARTKAADNHDHKMHVQNTSRNGACVQCS